MLYNYCTTPGITCPLLADYTMTDLGLNIQCYQDYQNGQTSYRMDSKMIMVGCDKALILKVRRGNSIFLQISTEVFTWIHFVSKNIGLSTRWCTSAFLTMIYFKFGMEFKGRVLSQDIK